MIRNNTPAIAALAFSGLCTPAIAQQITVDRDTPDGDRWVYPFNSTPGTRDTAPSFGAILIDGFDDRDAQFVVEFDLSGDIPTGLAEDQYRILSATLTATVSNDAAFDYDPTPDAYVTFLEVEDPMFVPDADAGRAVTVFGVDYRNGFDVTTWTETSPFGGTPTVPPAQGARNAFAADFDSTGLGAGQDVSNNLREGFDPTPLGVGIAPLASGASVPADTTFTFDLDACDAGNRAFLRQSLAAGKLNLAVSSIQNASGSPGGGDGVVYPIWYTRENVIAELLGFRPTLHLEVFVGSPADIDRDGDRDPDDINAFVEAFVTGNDDADVQGDCDIDPDDIAAFVNAFIS